MFINYIPIRQANGYACKNDLKTQIHMAAFEKLLVNGCTDIFKIFRTNSIQRVFHVKQSRTHRYIYVEKWIKKSNQWFLVLAYVITIFIDLLCGSNNWQPRDVMISNQNNQVLVSKNANCKQFASSSACVNSYTHDHMGKQKAISDMAHLLTALTVRGGDFPPKADGFKPGSTRKMSPYGQPRCTGRTSGLFGGSGAGAHPNMGSNPSSPPGIGGSAKPSQSQVGRATTGLSAAKNNNNSNPGTSNEVNKLSDLPTSEKYNLNLSTKTARKGVKNCLKNPELKKEVLSALKRIDQGELLPRHTKAVKGFETLQELKFTNT